jgi:hypothetical protein
VTCAERTAEILSLASGLALVWPALRLNQSLRKAQGQKDRAQEDRSSRIRRMRFALARAYESPEWNAPEQWLTIAGVVLMILSSGIRLYFGKG